jgi:hypothetical protein
MNWLKMFVQNNQASMGWLSAAAGFVSLAYATIWHFCLQGIAWLDALNHVIVGLWTLLPPIWFWLEWYFSPHAPGTPLWDSMTHGHEVSRNIWVALVVVLVAVFGLRWNG